MRDGSLCFDLKKKCKKENWIENFIGKENGRWSIVGNHCFLLKVEEMPIVIVTERKDRMTVEDN